MKKFNLVALAVILIASPLWSGWLQTTQAAYTATLAFANPANGVSRALDANSRFTIDVNVNTAGQDSVGTDVMVDFDATKLDFVAGGSSITNFYPANHFGPSVSGSRISMGATKQAGGANINSSGRFATLQFGLKSGTSLPTDVQFSFYYISQGATVDSNITSTSLTEPDLLAAPASATITLTAYVPVITHTITSLNPNNGAAAGSYPVTINGTNLDSLTTKTITWGSTSIPSTDSRVTSWGASSIALSSIPLGTANSTVAVTVSGATGSLTFTYNPVTSTTPNITNINPNQGTENGGTPVVLTGTNFGTTEGTVTLQTTPPVTVNASDVTWTSATSITFTTPAYAVSGNTGVSVSITTNGGLTSNSVTYTYVDENSSGTPTVNDPNIAYLTPSSGYADQDVLVTIVGTNFEPTGTTNGTVRFGNYTATIISWTDTAIQVYAPKLGAIASDITHGVTVTRSDGKSDIEYYTYLAPVSTGGTSTNTTTTPSGMPATVWFGLFSLNGGLAFLAKRKLTKHS